MTQNDYSLRLFNGDTGVIVARDGGRKSAVFERQGGLVEISPTRLDAVDTVHALTIHKSQGSQVDAVAVLLPDPSSRILTRELLYTAVTRARKSMIVCGTEAAIRAASRGPSHTRPVLPAGSGAFARERLVRRAPVARDGAIQFERVDGIVLAYVREITVETESGVPAHRRNE